MLTMANTMLTQCNNENWVLTNAGRCAILQRDNPELKRLAHLKVQKGYSMIKQYLVCVQQKHQQKDGEYYNLRLLVGDGFRKRYYNDLGQALKELQAYIAKQNRGERTETTVVNGFGIDMVIDAESAKDLAVVDWYIKVREVTPWEDCLQMSYKG